MKERIQSIFKESSLVQEATLKDNLEAIQNAVQTIRECLRQGGKLLIFGNGGSAADSQHIAAEFIGRFQKERPSLPAIALTTDSSILTALGNDYGFETVFARQIAGLGKKVDVAFAISTSGNSRNVLEGAKQARKMGLKVIGLSGGAGGKLAPLCDINLIAASKITARIQEAHMCLYHTICELVESEFSQK